MAEDKIITFKGKTLEELQKLSLEELAPLFSSDFRRKLKRGFTEQEQKFLDQVAKGSKNLKTHCRDIFVLPSMIGQKISIYNGKEFVQIILDLEMVGLRLGELAPTRKSVTHPGGGK